MFCLPFTNTNDSSTNCAGSSSSTLTSIPNGISKNSTGKLAKYQGPTLVISPNAQVQVQNPNFKTLGPGPVTTLKIGNYSLISTTTGTSGGTAISINNARTTKPIVLPPSSNSRGSTVSHQQRQSHQEPQAQQIFITPFYPNTTTTDSSPSSLGPSSGVPIPSVPISHPFITTGRTSSNSTITTAINVANSINKAITMTSNSNASTTTARTGDDNNLPLGIVFSQRQDQSIPMLATATTGSSVFLGSGGGGVINGNKISKVTTRKSKLRSITKQINKVPSQPRLILPAEPQPKLIIPAGDQVICPDCNKVFANKYTMKTHQKTHLGIKDYKCEVCAKCFSQKINLMYHRKTHYGEKEFTCPMCQKSFTQLGNCRAHCLKKHGIEMEKKRRPNKEKTDGSMTIMTSPQIVTPDRVLIQIPKSSVKLINHQSTTDLDSSQLSQSQPIILSKPAASGTNTNSIISTITTRDGGAGGTVSFIISPTIQQLTSSSRSISIPNSSAVNIINLML